MNSKAIKRQLLAAIAMVLVAAIALGSSTYAWFVASGTVEATGMKVKAQAEGNLVIRHKQKDWSTVAIADPYKVGDEVVAGTLLPASTADMAKWVHASAQGPNNFASASTSEYDIITNKVNPGSDDGGNCNGYVLVKQFFIRSATAENKPSGLYIDNIKVTVDGTAKSQNLSSSLRVGVKCSYGSNTPTTLIYAPVGTGAENEPKYGDITVNSTTKQGVYVPADGATDKVAKTAMTPTAITLAQFGWDDTRNKAYSELLGSGIELPGVKTATSGEGDDVNTSTSKDAVEVFVYVWFEGEDVHLYSDNFAAETMDISIEFQSISSKTTSA